MIGSVNTGGGAKAFAFIVVTYPAGSVCTCTDGTKTLRAKNTTGSWVFEIPYAGTWTVSCTDGTYTAEENVLISAKGQSESLLLRYILYLYKNGDKCVAVTGDYSTFNETYGGLAITYNPTNIMVKSTGGNGNLGTNIAIPFAGYSKLCIEISNASMSSTTVTVGAWSSRTKYDFDIVSATVSNGSKLYEIPISNLSQTNGFVGIRMVSSSGSATVTINNIYLLP